MANPHLSYELFTPADGLAATDLQVIPDTAIVAANHMGSSVRTDTGALGDAGRKAVGLANRTGYPVLAYDRPGTGPHAPRIRVDEHTVWDHAGRTADRLMDVLDAEGFEHVVLAGNSAAATDVVVLAHTDIMPVSHLSVMDPVGIQSYSFVEGARKWLDYNKQEHRQYSGDRTIDDDEAEAVGWKARAFFKDSRAYRRVWQSERTYQGLHHIAEHCGDIAVRACWPHHTFTAEPQMIGHMAVHFPSLRAYSQGTAPFTVARVSGSHGQFENFRTYADNVAKAIDPDFRGFEW